MIRARIVPSSRLSLLAVAIFGCGSPGRTRASVLLPWQDAAAEVRQVIRLRALVPRRDPVVELRLAAPPGARVRLSTETDPAVSLPVYPLHAGGLACRLPGALRPGAARLLIAAWSENPAWTGSPRLDRGPEALDDYARVRYDDAWDFDEGDQENIAHWGDRPSEYGPIEVRNGRLIVPVTGKDPYLVWGTMFGPPVPDRDERIDSRLYTILALRVRQSSDAAGWSLFVTDTDGVYRKHDFQVKGAGFQELRFDLAKLFPDFWDGREFRALRIDTTNDSPGTTVEIDWGRLSRAPVQVETGPVLTARNVAARRRMTRLRAQLPSTLRAGDEFTPRIIGLDARGERLAAAPVSVRLGMEGRPGKGLCFTPGEAPTPTLSAGTKAGSREWVAGACDDLGYPAVPIERRPCEVMPAPLEHYELIPERRLVPVSRRRVQANVWGVDRFGNRIPVDVAEPIWSMTGGGSPPTGALKGAPATVDWVCSDQPRTVHVVELKDRRGHRGSVRLTTLAYRKNPIRIHDGGYLADARGNLFLPLGGFYANWPAGLPGPDGSIGRALDLFPCNATPYPHGFPWSAEVERRVTQYLQLCHRHGVTTLRLMLRNMDIVGRVDRVQLQAVLHLFDLARPFGIRFNVVLFEDYAKPPYVNLDIIEKIALPHYSEEELRSLPPHRARFLKDKRVLDSPAQRYTDPDAVACQRDYLRELLPYLTDREEILCYEFENEMVRPPMEWIREMSAFLHRADPHTLVLGNPGPHTWPEPWRWRSGGMDLFSYHPYNDGLPEADHGAVIFARSKWAAAAGVPMFTGEGGINQNRWQPGITKVPPDYAARGIRDQIWLSLCSGAVGAFMWTPGQVSEMAEFGKVIPALETVSIDLLNMVRRGPDTAVIMPNNATANRRATALAYACLERGTDFDAVMPDGAQTYERKIDLTGSAPGGEELVPDFLRPAEGYQIACLATRDLSQILVYMRNTAGGIVSLGAKRPCYVRQPRPALPMASILGDLGWTRAAAYDLDTGTAVQGNLLKEGNLVLPGPTTHDFVIGLRR